MRRCEYSQSGARIVIFRARMVFAGVNLVLLLFDLFLYVLDPGDLELLIMSKGYIVAQIDQLIQFPEYTQVLQMDPPDVQDLPPKKRIKLQPSKGHHQLPSMEELRHMGEETESRIEGKVPESHEKLRGSGQVSADIFNLSDMRQVMRLQEYLQENGGYELFHTPKNGQCMFASIRRGMEVPEEYRNNHLRFQLAYFMVKNHAFCSDLLQNVIRFEYGHHRLSKKEYLKGMKEGTLTEAQIADYQVPGPFSFIGYLKYILEGSTWGDQGLLTLISMMWQVTITIVNAEDLSQIKIRHQRPLDQVNLVVVLAQRCHYLGTCKHDFCSLFLNLAVRCELSVSMVPYSVRIVPYSARMVNEFECGLVAKVTE